MKLRILARWLTAAALFLSAASAHAFYFDGIHYRVLSEEDRTVKVYDIDDIYEKYKVVIPERVVCDGITYTVTSIEDNVFHSCDGLTSVVFPASLTSIGDNAFYGCDGLTSAIYCQPQTPPFGGSNTFSDKTLKNSVLYVPIGTKEAYRQVDPWRNFWNVEETNFATVGINGVATQGAPSVTVSGGTIVVEDAAATDVVEVFTADGRCAYRGAPTAISHLPGGIYLVRVGKYVQKVAL